MAIRHFLWTYLLPLTFQTRLANIMDQLVNVCVYDDFHSYAVWICGFHQEYVGVIDTPVLDSSWISCLISVGGGLSTVSWGRNCMVYQQRLENPSSCLCRHASFGISKWTPTSRPPLGAACKNYASDTGIVFPSNVWECWIQYVFYLGFRTAVANWINLLWIECLMSCWSRPCLAVCLI